MPKFAIAAPGSAASQRIARLEEENKQLRIELTSLKAQLVKASEAEPASEEVPPPPKQEIPHHGHHSQRKKPHPVAIMSIQRCTFPGCGQRGHHEKNCQIRMKHDLEKIATECENGWHKPYLHDSMCKWRCQWCAMHLHEDYVQAMYPTEFIKERAKEAANHRKLMRQYTSRACNSQ